jgi:hypothetical protein
MERQQIIEAEMPLTRKQESKPKSVSLSRMTLNEQIEEFFSNGGIVDKLPYGQRSTDPEKHFNNGAKIPQTKWADESIKGSGELHCRACSIKNGTKIFHEISDFNVQSGGRGRKLDCKKWQKKRKSVKKKTNY